MKPPTNTPSTESQPERHGHFLPYQDNTGYRKRFAQQGIGVMPDLDLIRVTRDTNGISAEFTHCFSREVVTLHADQIVVEHGTQPLNELYHDLTSSGAFSGKVHLLGDAAASRDVHAAVREAYVTAISV